MYMNTLHLTSPIIYAIFVRLILIIPSCPESTIMRKCRIIHNVILSMLSLLMLIGISHGTYVDGKFNSLYDLLCLRYSSSNLIAHMSTQVFLYSKYLEWGDTVFLHLSGKQISMLQYTHHMTTVFLTHINLEGYVSPSVSIPQGLNCLVHIPMYWYFAFPTGFMYRFRKMITTIQIIQHIIVLITTMYTFNLNDCQQNKYGGQAGLAMYLMYLYYFSKFYLQSYIRGIRSNLRDE